MNVAVLGTGLMGTPISMRLIEKGHTVRAFNRTTTKLTSLEVLGAKICSTPLQAVEPSDVIITMLTDRNAFYEVIFNNAVIPALNGKVFINMATISPNESQDIEQALLIEGARYIEAPVIGSIPEARSGNLLLMTAGDLEVVTHLMPLLECLSNEPVYLGSIGKGAALKLAMNQLITGLTCSFALSLAMVKREGIEVEQFMHVCRQSAFYAPTFDKKIDKMLLRDFSNPTFPVKHLAKDIDLILEILQKHSLRDPMLAQIKTILAQSMGQSEGELDYSALFNVISPKQVNE